MGIEKIKSPEQIEREQIWRAAEIVTERVTDKLGKPIDRGVRPLVTAFLAHGFRTCGSCEGHLPRPKSIRASRGGPYIDIRPVEKEVDELEEEWEKLVYKKFDPPLSEAETDERLRLL